MKRADPDLPNALPRPPGELEALEAVWRPPSGWRRVFSVNNTDVGLWYLGTALLFFVLAGLLALAMRVQLAVPGNTLLASNAYAQFFTMHGTVMMFLFAVPVVEAVAVYLLPGMLGARDLPFPRLSAYAFWAYAIGGLAFFTTIFFGVAPDAGWFMYTPLSSAEQSPGLGADFWLLGIGFIEISAIAGAIELIVGIGLTRAPGMTLSRMPVFAWAMWVVAWMIVFAFPAVIAGTALLELERAFDWPFFAPDRGGDPLLWQHLFWFFGHPEVYIVFLPAAGLVSMMLPVVAQTPLVGRRALVISLCAVGVLSFAVWAHHMFTAGLGPWAKLLVSMASLAVALPAGVQVFAWIATLRRGRARATRWGSLDATTLFVVGFLLIFVAGGLTGVMVAVLPFDVQLHDTHFIVAHFHYVLIGGLVFPLFAALYHWMPLVRGEGLSQRTGRIAFALMFAGFHLTFFPMHLSGLAGMPRRVHTYADERGWSVFNAWSSAGAFVFAAGVALVFFDLIRVLRRPPSEHRDPWRAATLEWLPNACYGPRSIPQIDANEPLWQRPSLAQEVPAGRHWLPGVAVEGRETIATSFRAAKPLYLLRLPGDGAAPFVAALGTAGFFLLLTIKATALAWAFGIAAIVAVVVWLDRLDRAPASGLAPIGERVVLPVGARGLSSHAWWAMAIVLIVDATVWASFAFAHLHVSMLLEVCPPPGAALPPLAQTLIASLVLVAGSAALAVAHRLRARPGLTSLCAAVAVLAVLAAAVLAWQSHMEAGLDPSANAWSATVAALLAYQALHAIGLAAMGLSWIARALRGHLAHARATTPDVIALAWHGSTLQGLSFAALLHALPAWMAR